MYSNKIEIETFSESPQRVAVIIAFRRSAHRANDLYRISDLLEKISNIGGIAAYIVDSGSPTETSKKLIEICRYYKCSYISINTENELFSIAKARNVGASFSLEEYVFFHDLDLIATNKFYETLVEDTYSNWATNKFQCYPCFYLTEDATASHDWYADKNIESLREDYHLGGCERIQNSALASSCILIERTYFLSIGGYDFDFYGHGFEDFEFANRLCHNYSIFQRPYDYYRDTKSWFTGRYEGFRCLFAMHGNIQLNRGLYLAHLWHANDRNSDYVKSTKRNFALLQAKLKDFDRSQQHPHPLPDLNNGKTVALGKPQHLFYKSIREALPSFGMLQYIDEAAIQDPDDFLTLLKRNKIDRVLFPNPYGNEQRLKIYRRLKDTNFPLLISDRGALNNSYFFDKNGFNADSSSYAPENWDTPIPDSDQEPLQQYMHGEITSDCALESQGRRRTPESTRAHLGITSPKVLFVPFQRPVDTVCKYFCGNISSYEKFVELVALLSQSLGADWTIVAKKHPLENERPSLSGVVWADDDMHFKDLISISEAVLVINSGVGLQALLWNKKVIVAGEAYYNHPGLALHGAEVSEIKKILGDNNLQTDPEKVKRFVHYLRYRFYSFGEASVKVTKLHGGHNHSATTKINFSEIRLQFVADRKIIRDSSRISKSSAIYREFRHYFEVRNLADTSQQKVVRSTDNPATRLASRIKTAGFIQRNIKKLLLQPKIALSDTKNILFGY